MLKPSIVLEELRQALIAAHGQSRRLGPVNLAGLDRLIEHRAEDMTATAESGMTLAEFQNVLRQQGQWLPIDPPHPEKLSLGEMLSANLSGPRRFGYGTIRDYLIGLKVVLADGRLIKSGGKVVKNVAGYDMAKLFIGSRDSLGIMVEATFKLRPLPEAEEFVEARLPSLAAAGGFVRAVLESDLQPIVLDFHSTHPPNTEPYTVVLGFAGSREEVEEQVHRAKTLGATHASSTEYEAVFWSASSADEIHKLSVLPSDLVSAISRLGPVSFVARAGNGVIYYRGGPIPPKTPLPLRLMERAKEAFDPKRIFGEFQV